MSVFIKHHTNVVKGFSKENGWVIQTELEARIKAKIETIGIALKDWDVRINYGIKTGFNEAFIIDDAKRKELLKNCPEADAIIRPILRGREIHKYWIENNDQYLLFVPWHFPLHNDGSIMGVSSTAEEAFKKEYFAVYEHLSQFRNQLEKRNQAETGIRYEWYALQRFGSNYWKNFSLPKIIYPNMTKFMPFYYDESGHYLNDKCFMITGKHLSYLTAFLNSSIFKYCFINNFPELMGGTRELRKIFFDLITVKKVSDELDEIFKEKIAAIQLARIQHINTLNIEKEIDELLFDIYELTPEERQAIGFIEIL